MKNLTEQQARLLAKVWVGKMLFLQDAVGEPEEDVISYEDRSLIRDEVNALGVKLLAKHRHVPGFSLDELAKQLFPKRK